VGDPTVKCLYRINCGLDNGGVYVDRLNRAWLPDQQLSASNAWGALGGRGVYRDPAIPPGDDNCPDLYNVERFAMSGYEFRLADATYEVRLHFMETFESYYRAGFRAFDVRINGLRVLHQFDPYVAAGGFAKPVVKIFEDVGAPDGKLSIDLSEGAMINAIEIYEKSPAPAPRRLPKSMLFVGNSHCLFWELPLTLENFINTRPNAIHLETHRALIGGKDMVFHHDKTDVLQKIEKNAYDFVVIQSLRPEAEGFKQTLESYAEKYRSAVQQAGGQLLLYCTFPFKNSPPQAFDAIIEPHYELARKLGITFVPACAAWKESLQRKPELQLFNVSDTVHQGLWGAYLTACVFSAVLTGKSPVDHVPASILAGQIKLDPKTTKFLQSVAWDVVQRYRS
jgi:hypothetical protein